MEAARHRLSPVADTPVEAARRKLSLVARTAVPRQDRRAVDTAAARQSLAARVRIHQAALPGVVFLGLRVLLGSWALDRRRCPRLGDLTEKSLIASLSDHRKEPRRRFLLLSEGLLTPFTCEDSRRDPATTDTTDTKIDTASCLSGPDTLR